VVEDILHAMEVGGIKQNALATKLGKSRQYVGKILAENSRANFTIDTLAEISAVLGVQLCVRLIPSTDHMVFVRRPVTVRTMVAPTPPFPTDEATPFATDADEFESRNGFTIPKSHERADLPA
jgi:transcriptional regulator with XRE-family HTH domain